LIAELNKSLSTSDKKQQQQEQQQEQQQQDHEKQSELIEGPQPVPVQSSMAVVENTWKPTILVVDDSSMNRKVTSLLSSIDHLSFPLLSYHFVLSNHTSSIFFSDT
jgi:hypothetical protein